MTTDDVLRRLEAVKKNGVGYHARCPAHEDKKHSLTVRDGDEGGVLVYCHAGCSLQKICDALTITIRDLMPPKDDPAGLRGGKKAERRSPVPQTAPRTEYAWTIYDEEGKLQAVHRRRDEEGGKRFWWEGGLQGRRAEQLPLYGAHLVSTFDSKRLVFLVEGEKCADYLQQLGVQAVATVTGASGCPAVEPLRVLTGFRVRIWPDNDDVGREHSRKLEQALRGVAEEAFLLAVEGLPPKGDAEDWLRLQRSQGKALEELRALLEQDLLPREGIRRRLSVNFDELVALDRPARETIIGPLRERDTAQVYAKRGVGKTHFALGLSYAVASGGPFLRWVAPKPRGVLYVDGEMAAEDLSARVRTLRKNNPLQPQAPLRYLCADLLPGGLPYLGTEEGQRLVEAELDESIQVLVLDNLSCLFGGAENDAESWDPAQRWILSLKRRGLCVVFLHHAGKGGAQRGTSRREDQLDLVVKLENPSDYRPEEGARFEVHFEKSRGVRGELVVPFEAKLDHDLNGQFVWCVRDLEAAVEQRILALWEEGNSVSDVASLVGRHKSTVSRTITKLKTGGNK